jgi:hypothetical protein
LPFPTPMLIHFSLWLFRMPFCDSLLLLMVFTYSNDGFPREKYCQQDKITVFHRSCVPQSLKFCILFLSCIHGNIW